MRIGNRVELSRADRDVLSRDVDALLAELAKKAAPEFPVLRRRVWVSTAASDRDDPRCVLFYPDLKAVVLADGDLAGGQPAVREFRSVVEACQAVDSMGSGSLLNADVRDDFFRELSGRTGIEIEHLQRLSAGTVGVV